MLGSFSDWMIELVVCKKKKKDIFRIELTSNVNAFRIGASWVQAGDGGCVCVFGS